VQDAVAEERDARRGVEREAHRVSPPRATPRSSRSGRASRRRAVGLDAQHTLGVVLGPPDRVGERLRAVLRLQQLAMVEVHVRREVGRRELLADRRDQLLAQHLLDVRHRVGELQPDPAQVAQGHQQHRLDRGDHRRVAREHQRQRAALLGQRALLLGQERVGVGQRHHAVVAQPLALEQRQHRHEHLAVAGWSSAWS
jgi:hypothetical protein